jgi:hypothetical protein
LGGIAVACVAVQRLAARLLNQLTGRTDASIIWQRLVDGVLFPLLLLTLPMWRNCCWPAVFRFALFKNSGAAGAG